jgi:hypothetical protein
MKNFWLVLCVSIASFLLASCDKEFNVKSNSTDVRIPVHQAAFDVKNYSYASGNVYGKNYKSKTQHPSLNVLEFYDSFFKNINYEPFVEEYYRSGDRQWQFFEDTTIDSGMLVSQLNASWVNQDKTKRANLVLRYFWPTPKSNSYDKLPPNEDLTIDIQIMPFKKIPPPED